MTFQASFAGLMKTIRSSLGEMAQWLKHLPHQCEDVSSDPQSPWKAGCRCICHAASTPVVSWEVDTGHFLHAHKLASLASVEISETLFQTGGGDEQQERLSSDLHTDPRHICIHKDLRRICIHTDPRHICIHKDPRHICTHTCAQTGN